LYHYSFSYDGFEWINADDIDNSVYIYARKSDKAKDTLIIVLNVTPVYRENYRIGTPNKAKWKEIFNTDAEMFYGSGKLNGEALKPESIGCHNQKQSILINVPPLGVTIFKKATQS
jgi:1,4-alpha-glucan branching enzyme